MKIFKLFLCESLHHYQKCPLKGQLSLAGYAQSSVPGELKIVSVFEVSRQKPGQTCFFALKSTLFQVSR